MTRFECNRIIAGVSGLIVAISLVAPGFADEISDARKANIDGVAFLSAAPSASLNNLSVVEQLQTIRRLSQNPSHEAIYMLASALSSNYELARRTAARTLLEKAKTASPDEKKELAQAVKPSLRSADPVVQKNIERLLVETTGHSYSPSSADDKQ